MDVPVATHHLTHHIVVTNDAEVQRPDCVGYVTRTDQLLRSTHCTVCTVSEVVIDISALGALISVGDYWFSDPTAAFARKRRQQSFCENGVDWFAIVVDYRTSFLVSFVIRKRRDNRSCSFVKRNVRGGMFSGQGGPRDQNRPSASATISISMTFLRGCSLLTHVDLSEMHNVRAIDSLFLAHCRSLVTIDVTGLSQVTSVGGYFLGYCVALQTVVGLDSWINVTDVGENFLSHCSAIASLDLSGIPPR